MGCFSWKDCKNTRKRLRIGCKGYLLIPAEFGGGHIEESCYNGYGSFSLYDVYELVAIWNQKYLDEEKNSGKKPKREEFRGLWEYDIKKLREAGYTEEQIKIKDEEERDFYYNNALKRYKKTRNMIKDFIKGIKPETMRRKYGDDYLREIGITIACYDKDNASLKYPIKITTYAKAVYEECQASKSDDKQGLS